MILHTVEKELLNKAITHPELEAEIIDFDRCYATLFWRVDALFAKTMKGKEEVCAFDPIFTIILIAGQEREWSNRLNKAEELDKSAFSGA